ncbi:hypothetical protein NHG29_01355 [Aerococcaceae bacterium NML160702]|nr:hypothetical protein [Aerococcaceae bacterium NML190073]MCW6681513.1 hypothetical protein [Aerococcaceae bacterium NML160702]
MVNLLIAKIKKCTTTEELDALRVSVSEAYRKCSEEDAMKVRRAYNKQKGSVKRRGGRKK